MTINLADIPAAVANYMNTKVTTVVDPVIADSGSLNPAEEGSFKVTVTNADAPNGVRLVDVVHHLTIAPSRTCQAQGAAQCDHRHTLRARPEQLHCSPGARSSRRCSPPTWRAPGGGRSERAPFEVKGIDEGNADDHLPHPRQHRPEQPVPERTEQLDQPPGGLRRLSRPSAYRPAIRRHSPHHLFNDGAMRGSVVGRHRVRTAGTTDGCVSSRSASPMSTMLHLSRTEPWSSR